MEITTSNIKCLRCGVFNVNTEYCKNCGELISHQRKQEIRNQEIKKREIDEINKRLEASSFIDKMKAHPYFFVKILGYLLYSVWVVITVIAGALAWFIAMVAAG